MMRKVFYAGGLKFSCKRCSVCCRHESGYVFLSQPDLQRMAGRLKMDSRAFVKTFCRWGIKEGRQCLALEEKANFDCIFWDAGCSVYDARPLQCRAYPFWQSVLESPAAWEAAAGDCPGMNCGELHGADKIFSYLKLQGEQEFIEKQDYNQHSQGAREA